MEKKLALSLLVTVGLTAVSAPAPAAPPSMDEFLAGLSQIQTAAQASGQELREKAKFQVATLQAAARPDLVPFTVERRGDYYLVYDQTPSLPALGDDARRPDMIILRTGNAYVVVG